MTENILFLQATGIGLQAGIGLVAGLLIGLLHFATLRWNLHFFTGGSLPKAFLLQLLRLCFLGGALALLATFGAMALLCGMLGILIARSLVLRRIRRSLS